uniref:Uncharacterized protein n=1 Tax=Phlegmariurus squarrosus TaxID=73615 RepID=H9M896_PHLSQ|nr:hypothetical protein HusqMp124 [Phlegmariurus squarrosus]AEV55803.1 hypothetical protein HusqMp124 [Phlegmariurus squarrosus]
MPLSTQETLCKKQTWFTSHPVLFSEKAFPIAKRSLFLGHDAPRGCLHRESSLSREVLSWLPPGRWKRWKCQSFLRGEGNQTQSSSPRLDSLGRTPRPSVRAISGGGCSALLSYPHSGLYAGRSRLRVGVANRGKRSIKLMND